MRPPQTLRTVRRPGALCVAWLALLGCGPAAAQPVHRPPPGAHSSPYATTYPLPPPGMRGGHPYECDLYARDMAERYVPYGARVGGAAVRGAVGGAVFGAVVGGSKGARRGAIAGGGLGAVASGLRAQQDRETAVRLAYDDCMLGFRR